MNINKYIDLHLISEYAYKFADEYSLDLNDLPKHELSNFLDIVMASDSRLRHTIIESLQEMIDERLPFAFARDQYEAGMRPMHDPINGEVTWIGA